MIMKKVLLVCLVAMLGFSLAAQNQNERSIQEIKEVIQGAYIDGLQNLGDVEVIEEGFHPGFNLLIFRDNLVSTLPIYNWIEYTKRRKAANPDGVKEDKKVTVNFDFVDVTGTAAVAKIHLYQGEYKIYTDYLSLYKFEEGWKIVSKIYFQIPPPPPGE